MRFIVKERGPYQFDFSSLIEQVQKIDVRERFNILKAGGVFLEYLDSPLRTLRVDGLNRTSILCRMRGVYNSDWSKLHIFSPILANGAPDQRARFLARLRPGACYA